MLLKMTLCDIVGRIGYLWEPRNFFNIIPLLLHSGSFLPVFCLLPSFPLFLFQYLSVDFPSKPVSCCMASHFIRNTSDGADEDAAFSASHLYYYYTLLQFSVGQQIEQYGNIFDVALFAAIGLSGYVWEIHSLCPWETAVSRGSRGDDIGGGLCATYST